MTDFADEKLGIPSQFESFYIKVGTQPRDVEAAVYKSMTQFVAKSYDEIYLHTGVEPEVKFINYGDTELVYVISYGEQKFTLLFGQPTVPLNDIETEVNLLQKYHKNGRSTVVAPLTSFKTSKAHAIAGTGYFHIFNKMSYITPYYEQARCVASQEDGFGIYVPEPEYHFERFSKKESDLVCACMIAKLISLYDAKTKCGISACKLGGGDFILTKEWDREKLDLGDTLKCMKLIASRKEVHCSLKKYISLLREECTKRTYYSTEEQRDPNIIINHKARVGMSPEAVEQGIVMGLKLRKIAEKSAKTTKTASGRTTSDGGK